MDKNIIINPTKISVLLPTYNGSNFIDKAIKSVLDQTFTDFEIIIINDGSTDNTLEKISKYSLLDNRIMIINNEINLGIQKSLNKGLFIAKGEYIARIDSDDIWIDKDKLKKQFNFLEKNKDYVLIGTGAICTDEKGNIIKKYYKKETDKEIRKTILGYNCFIHSSVIFKKEVAIKIGGYSENIEERHVEDYDLWLKLGSLGKMYNIKSYCVQYTIRENSISNKNQKEQLKKTIRTSNKYIKYYPQNKFINLFRNYLRLLLYLYIK